jgi:hypothetical protein
LRLRRGVEAGVDAEAGAVKAGVGARVEESDGEPAAVEHAQGHAVGVHLADHAGGAAPPSEAAAAHSSAVDVDRSCQLLHENVKQPSAFCLLLGDRTISDL